MELIDWVEEESKGSWNNPNLVAYALIEAMSEKAGTEVDKVFSPFKPEALQVEFKVNGVELSFTGVMEKIQKAMDDVEEDCKKSLYKEVCQKVINDIQDKLGDFD